MAISDKWTKSQLRAAVRREIMDTPANFWTTAELDLYITAWQNRIQSKYELVWGSATATLTGSSTVTLTDLGTDVMRLGHVYYNNDEMSFKTQEELEIMDRRWRLYGTGTTPSIVYKETEGTIVFWPPIASTAVGTYVIEYPRVLSFANDSAPMEIPAWTKYSVMNYCAYRAYVRRGSNEDPQKAQRYKNLFDQQLKGYGTRIRNYFPKSGRTIRPGGEYEFDILEPHTNLVP